MESSSNSSPRWRQGGSAPDENLTGTLLDRYLILERLGRGGMGVVYKAYDPQVDRRVALKILRLKKRDKKDLQRAKERLLREAVALAQLAHPNVVAVYDISAVGDKLFMSMEYVEGRTLRDWVRQEHPPLERILAVMIAAGRGISAAHKAGLLHRDIKPSNIMVGADGRVRVLDFGLVRAMAPPTLSSDSGIRLDVREGLSGDRSWPQDPLDSLDSQDAGQLLNLAITVEGRVVGTPGYMAPEQYRGQELSSFSDQFSFCISLYEALYGQKAFAGTSHRQLGKRVIRGQIEPPPPESRVPGWLRRVVWKGLSVKPADRYPSMDALVDALARPPRAGRTRWTMVAALSALLLAVLVALLAAPGKSSGICQGGAERTGRVWNPEIQADLQRAFVASGRPHAEETTRTLARVLDAYTNAWTGSYRAVCAATQLERRQDPRLLDLRMSCLARLLRKLSATLEVFIQHPEGEVVDQALAVAYALPAAASCAQIGRAAEPAPPEIPRDKQAEVDRLRGTMDRVEALWHAGSYAPGVALVETAVARARAIGLDTLTAEGLTWQGRHLRALSRYPAAEAALREATTLAEDDDLLARIWLELMHTVGFEQSRFAEGRALQRIAHNAVLRAGQEEGLLAEYHRSAGALAFAQGQIAEAAREYQEALTLLERIHGGDHPEVAQVLSALGLTLSKLNQFDPARAQLERALRILEGRLGENHPWVARALVSLGTSFAEQRRYPEAIPYYQRARKIAEAALGKNHSLTAKITLNLALGFHATGQYPQAIALHRQALGILEALLGPTHIDLAHCHYNLCASLIEIDDLEQAAAHCRQAVAILTGLNSLDHYLAALAITNLGMILDRQGKTQQALESFQRALAACEKSVGATNLYASVPLLGIGHSLRKLHRSPEAIPHLERALAIREKTLSDPESVEESRFALALALWEARRDRPRALQLARQSQKALSEGGLQTSGLARSVASFLAGK